MWRWSNPNPNPVLDLGTRLARTLASTPTRTSTHPNLAPKPCPGPELGPDPDPDPDPDPGPDTGRQVRAVVVTGRGIMRSRSGPRHPSPPTPRSATWRRSSQCECGCAVCGMCGGGVSLRVSEWCSFCVFRTHARALARILVYTPPSTAHMCTRTPPTHRYQYQGSAMAKNLRRASYDAKGQRRCASADRISLSPKRMHFSNSCSHRSTHAQTHLPTLQCKYASVCRRTHTRETHDTSEHRASYDTPHIIIRIRYMYAHT